MPCLIAPHLKRRVFHIDRYGPSIATRFLILQIYSKTNPFTTQNESCPLDRIYSFASLYGTAEQ
jgi:hypothetical protein